MLQEGNGHQMLDVIPSVTLVLEAFVPSSPSILLEAVFFNVTSALLVNSSGASAQIHFLCWQRAGQVHLASCESSREGDCPVNL